MAPGSARSTDRSFKNLRQHVLTASVLIGEMTICRYLGPPTFDGWVLTLGNFTDRFVVRSDLACIWSGSPVAVFLPSSGAYKSPILAFISATDGRYDLREVIRNVASLGRLARGDKSLSDTIVEPQR